MSSLFYRAKNQDSYVVTDSESHFLCFTGGGGDDFFVFFSLPSVIRESSFILRVLDSLWRMFYAFFWHALYILRHN